MMSAAAITAITIILQICRKKNDAAAGKCWQIGVFKRVLPNIESQCQAHTNYEKSSQGLLSEADSKDYCR